MWFSGFWLHSSVETANYFNPFNLQSIIIFKDFLQKSCISHRTAPFCYHHVPGPPGSTVVSWYPQVKLSYTERIYCIYSNEIEIITLILYIVVRCFYLIYWMDYQRFIPPLYMKTDSDQVGSDHTVIVWVCSCVISCFILKFYPHVSCFDFNFLPLFDFLPFFCIHLFPILSWTFSFLSLNFD